MLKWLTICLVYANASAASYYVAMTGDDVSGDGSIVNPWRTVKHGVEALSAGDTLYLRVGTYVESTWPPSWTSGIDGGRKTITAYNGEAVTIQQNTATSPMDVIRFNDVDYWTFSGLVLDNSLAATNNAGANVVKLTTSAGDGSDFNTFTNCTITGSVRGHGALLNGGSDNNLFTHCTFTNNTILTITGDSPPHAIYIQSPYNVIDHCTFEPGGSHDLDVHCYETGPPGASWCVVKYCLFRSGCKPIGFIHGSSNTAYNCVMYNTSGQSITAGEATQPSTGHYIANLSIYGSTGPQIYASTNVVVENILVGPCAEAGWGFAAESGAVNCIFRNIVIDSGFTHFAQGWFWPESAQLSNIFTNVSTAMLNPPSNMKLSAASYAIDRGTAASGFSDDYDGNIRPFGVTWDIGAYEFFGSSIIRSQHLRVTGSVQGR